VNCGTSHAPRLKQVVVSQRAITYTCTPALHYVYDAHKGSERSPLNACLNHTRRPSLKEGGTADNHGHSRRRVRRGVGQVGQQVESRVEGEARLVGSAVVRVEDEGLVARLGDP